MHADAHKLAWDARQALERVLRFVKGKEFADYEADDLLRSAVERQLSIVGEALARLRAIDADVAQEIPELARVIGFRNVLIHGYASVDNRLVWGVVETHAAALHQAIRDLLEKG